jgi:anti-sigma regulatory factor (Ser/Thr protein kinase)
MTSAERPDRAGWRGFEAPRAAVLPVQSSPVELVRRVPAEAGQVAGIRHAVLSFAEARGATKATRGDIALAVSEACTNVVMHAYVNAAAPGSLTVKASHLNDELVVAVRDDGRGMLPRPDSPGLGLGLSIIGRLSQRLEIDENGAFGTEVRMTFAVAAER